MDSGRGWEAGVEEAGTTSRGHTPAYPQASGSQSSQVYLFLFGIQKSDVFPIIDSIFTFSLC